MTGARNGKKFKAGKERKGKDFPSWGRTKARGNDSLRRPEACVCYILPTTYAQLSNDKTSQKHSVRHLTQHITQPGRWWLSLDTYQHTPHKSIHQAAATTMSEVAAGEPGNRCFWQMVPSALASGRQQTSSLSFPLTALLVLITFHFLSNFSANYQRATWKGRISKTPMFHRIEQQVPFWLSNHVVSELVPWEVM